MRKAPDGSSQETRPVWKQLVRDADLCLVDIGARGGSRPAFKRLARHARLVACEPEQEEADRLVKAASGGLPWREVTLIREAIGSRGPTAKLHIMAKPGLSSLLAPNPAVLERFDQPGFEVVATQVVPMITLDAAAAKYSFRHACCLKLDTQGTELDILRSGSALVERSVVAIYVETNFHPFYVGQSLFADIDVHLRERSFILTAMYPKFLRGTGADRLVYSEQQPVWAHCLYLRDPEVLAQTSDPLPALARWIMLAMAYRQHDIAIQAASHGLAAEVLRSAYGLSLGAEVTRRAAVVTRKLAQQCPREESRRASQDPRHGSDGGGVRVLDWARRWRPSAWIRRHQAD